MIFKISFDPTRDYVPIVIWTELEIATAFACVTLTAIRILLVKTVSKRLRDWLSEVTHESSHATPRQVMPREGLPRCEAHKDDTGTHLASTELAVERLMCIEVRRNYL
jgi:hypothetical protein